MESTKEYNKAVIIAVEVKDDMEAPENHKDTNNKDIKDANLDATVGNA